MPTIAEVHQGIDELTAATLQGWIVLYDGMISPEVSEGSDPFIRQEVRFSANQQAELTDRCFRRHRGYVIFYLHWRRGAGASVRNQLQTLIENAFVCTTVAGATMQNARTVPVGTTENWEILGVQVQFYFDEVI